MLSQLDSRQPDNRVIIPQIVSKESLVTIYGFADYAYVSKGLNMELLPGRKTASHLMNLITTRNADVPNFALLLGSGASATSKVATAQDMIAQWRSRLFTETQQEDYQDWLRGQPWYEHEDEYSILFESVYDQPSQRRVYIEECIKDAHPSWGYVYLSNLLANRFFNVVFTTNFDDLINEACYLYSDGLRPIVAAHDSAIQGIRVTSSRPKIIKLHGDFLYDDIKNTIAELETLETNTKRKLHQFAQEYGLVVLGYSGRDRSVMDTLDLLLRDEENYKQGVYWCVRRGSVLSKRLESLLRRDRVYLVEIDGFDELMADLHKTTGLSLPRPIARPFDIAQDRVRLFIENPLRSHPVIGAHVREVLGNLRSPIANLPLQLEAALLSSAGDLTDAVHAWREAYNEDPANERVAYRYADAMADGGQFNELVSFIAETPPLSRNNLVYFLLRADENQKVIDLASQFLEEETTGTTFEHLERTYVRINRAIAYKRLDDNDRMTADLDVLEQDRDSLDPSLQAGIAALRGDKATMLSRLKSALHKTISPVQLMVFPVFEDYRDDLDFQELLSS